MTLRRDGSFDYRGSYAVAHLGSYRGQVEPGELEQVLRYIGEIGFMDLEPHYPSPRHGIGSAIITVVPNSTCKTVTNDAGSGPITLWAPEKLLDDLLEHEMWERSACAT